MALEELLGRRDSDADQIMMTLKVLGYKSIHYYCSNKRNWYCCPVPSR